MNEATIEMICQKLGTTVENIIPAVIEYCTHDSKVGLAFGCILLAIGIFSVGFAIIFYRRDEDGIPVAIFIIIAVISFIIGFIFTIGCGYDLHILNKFPEMYAYRTILRWLNG